MNITASISIIIFTSILTLMILSLKKMKNTNNSHQRAVEFNTNIRNLNKKFKKELRKNPNLIFDTGHEIFSIIPEEISNFLEDTSTNNAYTFRSQLLKYKLSPKWRIFRAKIIWISSLTLSFSYFFCFDYFFLDRFTPLNLSFNLISIFNLIGISFIISIIFVRIFTHQERSFHPERAFQVKKDILMLKLSNLKKNLNILESKQEKGGYFESIINSRLKKIVPKILISSLMIISSYAIVSGILNTSSILLILNASIVMVLLIFFLISMVRIPNQKLENFSLFLLLISLYTVFKVISLSSLIVAILSGLLSIISFAFFIINRKIRVKTQENLDYRISDFIFKNLTNILPLIWFYHDFFITISFFVSIDYYDIFNPINWIPIIFLLLSLKVFLTFIHGLRNGFSEFLGFKITTLLIIFISIVLSYCSVFVTFKFYNFNGTLLIFSFSLVFLLMKILSFIRKKLDYNEKNINSINKEAIPILKPHDINKIKGVVDALANQMQEGPQFPSNKFKLFRKSKLIQNMGEEQFTELQASNLKSQIENLLVKEGYEFLEKKKFSQELMESNLDYIAFKNIEVGDVNSNLLILLIDINLLKGKLFISNKIIYYSPNQVESPENNNLIPIMKFPVDKNIDTMNLVMRELYYESSLLQIIKDRLNLDLQIKETISKNISFYYDKNGAKKIILNQILISQQNPFFIDKDVPFPKNNKHDLYVIDSSKISPLIHYLEEKYVNLESYSNLREFSRSNKILNKFGKISLFAIIGLFLVTLLVYFLPYPFLLFNTLLCALATVSLLSLLFFVMYIRQTAFTVMKSVIPYNKLPLRIEREQFELMRDIFSIQHLNQFIHEYNISQ